MVYNSFSLIMVLSIYYLTMSDDTLSTLNVSATDNDKTEVVISENETLVALRVADEEALVAKMAELEGVLLNDTASLEEKIKPTKKSKALTKMKV